MKINVFIFWSREGRICFPENNVVSGEESAVLTEAGFGCEFPLIEKEHECGSSAS